MAVSVSADDVTNARNFLTEFISDNIPDGDYSDGAFIQDMAIKAIAYAVAYLQKTDEQIRARQSLDSLENVDTSDDAQAADDAADAILSNWYLTRNQGQFARLVAFGNATERIDITVGADVFFYKTASLPFILDNQGDDLTIDANELVAQFDSSGEITGYTFRIPLVSQEPGTAFNVEPGRFASFDDFSPYVTYIENLESTSTGDDIESTPDMIDRGRNAVTVRNLINARSCDAVLRDEFEEIRQLTVIGFGDNEMVRDFIQEPATGLALHVGGHQDIFINTDPIETAFSGVVGAKFARPDGVINVFRDTAYADYDPTSNPGGHKFTDPDPVTTETIVAGMSLRIWLGLPIGPRDFIIREVRDTELYVSEKVPFPVATDVDGTFVTWSVGLMMPDYQEVVGQTVTGETSSQVQNEGRITLPGRPLYQIKDVTVDDPSNPDADPTDGLVHFNVRTNIEPTEQTAPDNEYQVIVHNPEDHQSSRSYTEILVNTTTPTAISYDGKTLKVTYDTTTGFDAVDNKVSNRRDRISAANPLTRAYHPAYLSFALEYRLFNGATETVDDQEAVEAVVGYINTFPPTEIIDVSLISDFLKQTYTQIGQVYPFVISYTVHVPDGRLVEFESTNLVTVPSNVSQLRDLLVDPDTPSESLLNPLDFGISDDTLRYLTTSDRVIITERS